MADPGVSEEGSSLLKRRNLRRMPRASPPSCVARTNGRAVSLRDYKRLQLKRKNVFSHTSVFDAVRLKYRKGMETTCFVKLQCSIIFFTELFPRCVVLCNPVSELDGQFV